MQIWQFSAIWRHNRDVMHTLPRCRVLRNVQRTILGLTMYCCSTPSPLGWFPVARFSSSQETPFSAFQTTIAKIYWDFWKWPNFWRLPPLINVEMLLQRICESRTISNMFGYQCGRDWMPHNIDLGGRGANKRETAKRIHYFGKIPNILAMVVE